MRKQWVDAFFVDEDWAYSESTERGIAEIIGPEYVQRATSLAQLYRGMRENESKKPRRGEVRRQLDDLGDLSHKLLKALQLHSPAEDELQKYTRDDVGELIEQAERSVGALRTLAWVAERDYTARGRPRESCRRHFLYLLADLWCDVTGEWPKRFRDSYSDREGGRFGELARVCCSELPGFSNGLDDLIREVCEIAQEK